MSDAVISPRQLKVPFSVTLDLSGGATDIEVLHATVAGLLLGYDIVYTEASSGNAGVTIRIGRYQDDVALDNDFFDTSTSEVSKDKGYAKQFATTDLSQTSIAAGDTVTVGTAGGKVGAGEVRVVLRVLETG